MKKKLELKHVAPYLPYGLKILTNSITRELLYELSGYLEPFKYISIDNVLSGIGHKLILRPLSDYTDINSKASQDLNLDIHNLIELNQLANKHIGYWNAPYGVIEIMCENHIDFQNLIENGLAIDINTLQTTQPSKT